MFINTFLGPWLWFTRISQEILWAISAEEVRAEDSAVVPPALWWALNINHQMARHFWWENSHFFQYFHHFILVIKYIQVLIQDLLRKRGKQIYFSIMFQVYSKYMNSPIHKPYMTRYIDLSPSTWNRGEKNSFVARRSWGNFVVHMMWTWRGSIRRKTRAARRSRFL